ncbi:DUF3768 domain-containing protein [Bradyrhizobium sp.]|uniref:DUF3768 domain-containing protein n=1 Tax=Bradyrhizobium sp. TaxID=376 RepID=UPI001EC79D06|nr:DUF3768 domain-containing protein [Bradyrhizobium sp.]MBV8771491.1 DUF3768 domain-containing protein [Deltaproteobacteria bacterium]MBV9983479.1 DUF3768 domain-containing protein [Bradyrhizobium sp.]
MTTTKAQTIASLNDQFRKLFFVPSFGPRPVPGRIVCTSGIAALPGPLQIKIWAAVSNFSAFDDDNDPHGEHDFGALDIEGAGKVFWKVDYYADESCTFGADDPADPQRSFRVLTIMLASEC